MSNTIGASQKIAHFLRANFKAASKPGHFLNWVANKLSPRETYFHPNANKPAGTPLNQRRVMVQENDYISSSRPQESLKEEHTGNDTGEELEVAQMQFEVDDKKMMPHRKWAGTVLQGIPKRTDENEHGGYATNHVMTTAIRQMDKENPERVLALFEEVFDDFLSSGNINQSNYKEKLRDVLANSRTQESHTDTVLKDVNCALDIAYAKVFSDAPY